MAVLELYGKCKELGYCDCKGFFGCVDPRPPAPKPVIENELRNAMQAEREVSDYKNHNLKNELALVECQVCDRSHAPVIRTSPISTATHRSMMNPGRIGQGRSSQLFHAAGPYLRALGCPTG